MADTIPELVGMLPDGLSELPQDVAEELQREIQRNEEAVRLLKQKQLEAQEAKQRAEDSKKQMELMSTRFEDMRRKLEMTHETLAHTKVRIESHELLKSKVQKLKSLANSLSEKQRQRLLPSESENKVLKEYVKPDYGKTIESLAEMLESDGKSAAVNELEAETNKAVQKATEMEEGAKRALQNALDKENEAKAMKEKIEMMSRLLMDEQMRLSATEHKIETKANVVDKVNKILDSKERRVKFVENQKVQALVFDKKPKK